METLTLDKGNRVDLTKTNPGLKVIGIGLGWDVKSGSGDNFDLDAFGIALVSGKLPTKNNIVFFNQKTILAGALVHSGDNLTGEGDGDDETIITDLSKLPADITEILLGVNIYEAEQRRQNFGQVNNAFIRLYDKETNQEILKYDLSEDFSATTGMILGKLYLKDAEWKFQAMGEAKTGNIFKIAEEWQ